MRLQQKPKVVMRRWKAEMIGEMRSLLLCGACLYTLLISGCRPDSTAVVLVGSIHHFHLLHPGNSPAHLRALLERIGPDVVLVENPPSWTKEGRHFWIHLPEHVVVSDYATHTGAEVLGIDWVGEVPCFWGDVSSTPEAREQRLAALAGQAGWEASLANDPSWALAAVQDRIELARMEPESRAALDDSATVIRTDSLAERITRAARAMQGRRIAVLIGSSQLYPLASRLSAGNDLILLDARDYLPTASAVLAATTPEDRIRLLGFLLDRWLVRDTVPEGDLVRAESLIRQLSGEEEWIAVVEYYRARVEQLRGERAAAADRLDRLLASRDTTVLPALPNSEWSWPPWDRIDWKAKFARATLYDGSGNHVQGAQAYRDLMASLPPDRLRPRFRGPAAYYDLLWYLDDLVATPYRNGSDESLRAQASLRCYGTEAMSEETWPR